MTATRLLEEATEFTAASIRFAQGIDYATAGSRLSDVVERTMAAQPVAFGELRDAVYARLEELGGAGEATGLFMLAADMATTAHALSAPLSADDRRELRRLWDDLRAQ